MCRIYFGSCNWTETKLNCRTAREYEKNAVHLSRSDLGLSEAKLDVMHCSQIVSLFLCSALASARPGILDNLGILQNLGITLGDQPGKYIKGDASKGDVRSPCPAVNVLANLGYL
jgi:hypothetical protein